MRIYSRTTSIRARALGIAALALGLAGVPGATAEEVPADEAPDGQSANAGSLESAEPNHEYGLFIGARDEGTQVRVVGTGAKDIVVYQAAPGEVIKLDWASERGLRVAELAEGDQLARAGFVAAADVRPVAGTGGTPGVLDLGAGGPAQLFSSPGLTDHACDQRPSACAASLASGTKVEIVDARLMIYQGPAGDAAVGNFYRVIARIPGAAGQPPKAINGWISARLVLAGSQKPQGARARQRAQPICQTPAGAAVNNEARSSLGQIANGASAAASDALADQLSTRIGACLLSDSEIKPSAAAPAVRPNVYEARIKPYWQSQGPNSLAQETTLSQAQIEAIDTFARVLYAEQSSAWCGGKSQQNYTGVAAVALNRVQAIKTDPTMRTLFGVPSSGRDPIIDVLMSPYQWSVANPAVRVRMPILVKRHKFEMRAVNKPNPSLRQLLCPPSRQGEPYFGGRQPFPVELVAWKGAVRTATQAVLYGDQFRARSNISELYYTGPIDNFQPTYARVPGKIADGLPLDDNCVRIWASPNGR